MAGKWDGRTQMASIGNVLDFSLMMDSQEEKTMQVSRDRAFPVEQEEAWAYTLGFIIHIHVTYILCIH